jgi:hypothetical protein
VMELSTVVMRIRAVSAVAESMAGMGQLDRATAVADRALVEASGLADAGERIRALLAVAEAMAVIAPIDDALSVARSIDDVDARVGALEFVAAALMKAGRLDRALAVAASIADPDLDTDAPTAAAAAEEGPWDRATAALGRRPDARDQSADLPFGEDDRVPPVRNGSWRRPSRQGHGHGSAGGTRCGGWPRRWP